MALRPTVFVPAPVPFVPPSPLVALLSAMRSLPRSLLVPPVPTVLVLPSLLPAVALPLAAMAALVAAAVSPPALGVWARAVATPRRGLTHRGVPTYLCLLDFTDLHMGRKVRDRRP